ncbi:hypothetical protein ETD86_30025 [Nonomuraea turkmeniaca]|uniref:Uncharacterized protein n=1 Tax=Nonomuraea turkmeniaca TaxID=103838 RepID=A0A5S4FA00_9ACTN|nr:hypothetical protein [Nonomuraea turkmeniaca]TMR13804.1 hypothetical protein ETD86_30025 [Nonomuraea turkmeniaca]
MEEMHLHLYTWTGPRADRRQDHNPSSPGFATSPLPCSRPSDWLAKPADRISDTVSSLDEALVWLAAQYGHAKPLFLREDRFSLRQRLRIAEETLRTDGDVHWGEYLTRDRYFIASAVRCPNTTSPRPCPLSQEGRSAA